ncbi:MAG: DedA family protein [Proteobacteria bacterium]|nr:DedA family protein [Pseudomonadota bacterium]
MLRRLYDWTLRLAGHRHAVWWLFVLAVAEASFFPIPIEALLLPMMFAAPRRCWSLAVVATLGSVLGGAAGYAIGAVFFDSIGAPLLGHFAGVDPASFGAGEDSRLFFATVVTPIAGFFGVSLAYEAYMADAGAIGALIVLAGGFTPLPFKVVTIAAGFAQLDFGVFLLACLVSRGLRFAIEAGLLAWFGPPIRQFIERRLALAAALSFLALVALVAVVKWLW